MEKDVEESLSRMISEGLLSYPDSIENLEDINSYLEKFRIPDVEERPPVRYISDFEGKSRVINLSREDLMLDKFIDYFTYYNRSTCVCNGENPIQDWTGLSDQIASSAIEISLKSGRDLDTNALSIAIDKVVKSCSLTSISATLALFSLLKPRFVLDLVSSWGERAVAAHLSETVESYKGFDTNINLYDGYVQLIKFLDDSRLELITGIRYDRDVMIDESEADLIYIDSSKLTGDNPYSEDIPLHPMAWMYLIKRARKHLILDGHIVVYDRSDDQYGAGLAISELNNDPELRYLGAIGIKDDINQDRYFHIWKRESVLDIGELADINVMQVINN